MNRYASNCERMEQFARARGLRLGILSDDCNGAGRYFVASEDGKPLVHWRPLGWTRRQAEQSIREMIAIHQLTERAQNGR